MDTGPILDRLERLHASGYELDIVVYVYCLNDVSDLVQRTFLGLVEAKESFRQESSLRTFLYAIARKELHKHFARQRRDARLDFGVSTLRDLSPSPAHTSRGCSRSPTAPRRAGFAAGSRSCAPRSTRSLEGLGPSGRVTRASRPGRRRSAPTRTDRSARARPPREERSIEHAAMASRATRRCPRPSGGRARP